MRHFYIRLVSIIAIPVIFFIAGCASVDEQGVKNGVIRMENPSTPYRLTGTWLLHSGDGTSNIPAEDSHWRTWRVPDGQATLTLDDTEKYLPWLKLDFFLSPAYAGKALSLMIPVNGNYSIFLNGKCLRQYIEYGEIVQTGPMFFQIESGDLRTDKNELRLQGARLIGISGPSPEIFLGTPDTVMPRYIFRWSWYCVLVGLFAFLAFYHWQMFYKRNQEISYFWLGGVMFFNAVYVLSGAYLIFSVFPINTWIWLIWWYSIAMVFPFYLYFVQTIFNYPLNRYSHIIAGAFGLWALFPTIDFLLNDWTRYTFKIGLKVIGPISLIVFGYIYKILFRAIREKQVGARIITLGFTVFLITTINDQLVNLNLYLAPLLVGEGTFFFMACMTVAQANRFAAVHENLDESYKVIENYSKTLEQKVLERTAELRQKTNDIQNMMQNMQQGIFTIIEGNKIHHEYSAYLESIFETKEIADADVMTFVFQRSNLGPDEKSGVETTLTSCIGEDRMNFEFNTHLLPVEIDYSMANDKKKDLELSWEPICNDENIVEKIMIIVRDVTELKALQKQANQQKRELQIIAQILSITQEKMHEFISSAYNFLEANQKLINETDTKDAEVLNSLFRNMHTIKGNARTYGFINITNIVHEVEQEYDDLRKITEKAWDKDHLFKQLMTARTIIEEYDHFNTQKLGRKGPGRRGDVDKFVMVEKIKIDEVLSKIDISDMNDLEANKEIVHHIKNTLSLIGTQTIQETISGILESLPSLAKELNKENPAVTITDNNIYIKNQVFGLLRNVFMHIFRNSLDHGIETAEERLAAQKPAAGKIELDMQITDGQLMFRYRDDGKGLALPVLKKKGIEKGLLDPETAYTSKEIAELIFHSGLSTSQKVTEVSGRGVGMDAVKKFLEREKGSVEINLIGNTTAEGLQQFEFLLSLPQKFSVTLS